MGEKFNSGMGGYICDSCRVLLWAGPGSLKDPLKRKFVYKATAETIVELEKGIFCSDICASKFKGHLK